MALDKLGIYNDALLIIGERALASLTEAREPRFRLDAAWDIGAADYCLELVQPRSASLTSKLQTPTTDPDHGLTSVHALPADYINVVGVFSDASLDQRVSRYLIEGKSLICDYPIVYLRYTVNSDTYDVPDFKPSFAKVVGAFLAREITQRFDSDDIATIDDLFNQRLARAIELDGEKEPANRPKSSSGTLSASELGLYNDSLMLLGQEKLSDGDDDSFRRVAIDTAIESGSINYCLEIVQPRSASITAKLSVSTTDPDHGFSNVYSLPSDYINVVGVFSDASLDQPIERYLIEGVKILCDYGTIYFRYTVNVDTYSIGSFTPSFSKVVSAFIASEISNGFKDVDAASITASYESRLALALALDSEKEPKPRAKASTGVLTQDWLKIYNDALLILGLEKLTNGEDDSNRRSVIDTAVDSGLVESIIEDIGWQFAITSVRSDFNPSIEIDWGYTFAHDHPTDMLFLNGMYSDERFETPIKRYQDESGVFYNDYQCMFIQYVSTNFLTTTSSWTRTFRRYVAAQLAKDSVGLLNPSRQSIVEHVWSQRKRDSRSLDAMQSPPRRITRGNWAGARLRGDNTRDRP